MHEMATIQEVIAELNRLGNPKRIKVRLGAMRAEPEHFREAFNEYVKGSPLEGTELDVEDVPVEGFCTCGFAGPVEIDEHIHFARCPNCNSVMDTKSGNELEVAAVV
jgi:Zn finger protein HypA/HybF involved in hydrogenase expression